MLMQRLAPRFCRVLPSDLQDDQNYSWGKKGHESLAARLCKKTSSSFQIDDDKEYSEMWMGTYPVIPSRVLSTGENLQDVINADAEKLVGKTVLEKFGKDLPFLPKVLSIAKALPLQIHPSKALASELHKKDPDNFTDPNHKPEIAVALTEFELFVNFKPLADIESLLQLEPLSRFRQPPSSNPGSDSTTLSTATLKQVCKSMLEAPPEAVADVQSGLSALPRSAFGKQGYILDLLPRLQSQYSESDNGSLIALICMNFLTMQPGQAIYVPADGLHAYLSGDIIECMARSNNMLNAGFCPPADRDDINLFTEALTFNPQRAEEALLVARVSERGRQGRTKVYEPPMSEFDMLVTRLGPGEGEMVDALQGPSVMVVTSGAGKMMAEGMTDELAEGSVYFVGQGVELGFETVNEDGLVVYRAFAE